MLFAHEEYGIRFGMVMNVIRFVLGLDQWLLKGKDYIFAQGMYQIHWMDMYGLNCCMRYPMC